MVTKKKTVYQNHSPNQTQISKPITAQTKRVGIAVVAVVAVVAVIAVVAVVYILK